MMLFNKYNLIGKKSPVRPKEEDIDKKVNQN